ncbi:MAG: T9SS type A sorting domain-containing protein [Bacteroidota bacterium]
MWITPVCAQADTVRNWVVHNPNAFAIHVDWVRRYVPLTSGDFIAQPGDNNFSIRNQGWPNTVVISWYDQNAVKRSIVQASNDDLCSPPECAHIDGITFYHQGRQRNGSPVDPLLSYAEAVNGPPDADGNPSSLKAFSLGYNGFITMKLNANVYDQPGNDLKVWEYTLNDPDFGIYPEQAEVFVSTDNANWISLGKTNPTNNCRSKLDWEFDLAGKATWCRYVKVVDVTERWALLLNGACAAANGYAFNDVSNGFDLDAVTCANYNNSGARTASDLAEAILVDKDGGDQYAVAYPNPARLWLTLDFARDPEFIYPESGQVEINIIDMTGKIGVGGIHYLDNEWKTRVNVENLSPGLFVAKVRANGVTKHYKFVRN